MEFTTAANTRSNLARTPLEESIAPMPDIQMFQAELNAWENSAHTEGFNAIACLERMAQILEKAAEDFLQQNPDPLDDRHPSRTHPHVSYGIMLKAVVRKDNFIQTLVISYLMARDNILLSESAARVLLSCVPGLDSESVFSDPEELIPCLYRYAKESESETLRAYSFGLLASAMEVQENAGKYRNQNAELIPIALQRLKKMKEDMDKDKATKGDDSNSSGGHGDGAVPSASNERHQDGEVINISNVVPESGVRVRKRTIDNGDDRPKSPKPKKRKVSKLTPMSPPRSVSPSASNSQWNIIKHVLIGTHKIYPLTTKMHQRLIIQYLGTIGEYQDLLGLAYEGNSMSLLFDFINIDFTDDIRFTFDALKYLCSLLVHRKFALEFIARKGVEALLKVPSTSLAAVGVATCFYYLSYGEDVMEKVCQLSDNVLDELMDYVLWVQEHSHESGMASATMFLSHALSFRAILDRFDVKDGPRKMCNYMSTLTLLQDSSNDVDLTEEQIQTSTQTVRNACSALRCYVASHLYLRVEQYRRHSNIITSKGTLSNNAIATLRPLSVTQSANIPYYKPMNLEDDILRQAVWMLASLHKVHYLPWKAIEDLCNLGVIKVLLVVLLRAHEWTSPNTGRTEIAVNALEAIWISATMPRVQKELCQTIKNYDSTSGQSGLAILLSLSDGSCYQEAEIQIAALSALISCMTPPMDNDRKKLMLDVKRKQSQPYMELMRTMTDVLRKSNVIMTLITLIQTKKPVTAADEIRALTCKLLVALSRDVDVRQILLKLPLISANELHDLMSEPVCPDKKSVHSQFCVEAKNLIAIVTEKSVKDVKKDFTQERLWKSHIVSSTRIAYNEKELIQLIHSHLLAKGYTNAASALSMEADLSNVNGGGGGLSINGINNVPTKSIGPLPCRQILTRPKSPLSAHHSPLPSSGLKYAVTPGGKPRKTKDVCGTPFPRRLPIRPTPAKLRNNEKFNVKQNTMELNDIVTEYFRVQHSNCMNPVSTCPPFSLFHPHRCPEPSQSKYFPLNITTRWINTPLYNPKLSSCRMRMDESFIYSRFRPSKIFQEHEEMYTACSFSIDDEHLIVGMFSGEIHWMNIESGLCEATAQCHHSAISDIIPSKDGSMLLTSGLFMPPQSTLWRLGDQQEHLMDFPDDTCVLFNNSSVQDRIIGTCHEKARVYDIETGRTLHVLQSVDKSEGDHYKYAKASFSPCDTLILHDNTLYDVRQSNPIVKSFDRLNITNGGVFHPHGSEIIIDSEVWDMRSYALLHSVPHLSQTRIVFNETGNVILSGQYAPLLDPYKTQYSSTLRTISAIDYSVISTLDTRKPLMDFCLSNEDGQLAMVEIVKSYSQNEYFGSRSDETACRTYEIGKVRVPEDDAEEENGDEDIGDDNRESSDSDDSDDSADSSDDSDGSEGALDYLGRVAGETDHDESSVESSDDNDDDEEDGEDDGSSSSGWATASNQEEGEDNAEEEEVEENDEGGGGGDNGEDDEGDDDEDGSDISVFMDDGSDVEDDQDDPAYNPDLDERGGTSNIILNPNLRRNRRQGGGGGEGGQGGTSSHR